jgi:hypothetical protein
MPLSAIQTAPDPWRDVQSYDREAMERVMADKVEGDRAFVDGKNTWENKTSSTVLYGSKERGWTRAVRVIGANHREVAQRLADLYNKAPVVWRSLPVAFPGLVTRYLSAEVPSAFAINQGHAADFANWVLSVLDKVRDVQMLSDFDLLTEERDALSVAKLRRYAKDPLPGLPFEEFVALLRPDDLAHTWLFCRERHYDAEVTSGIINVLHLPAMRRAVVAALRVRAPDRFIQLSALPWWQQSITLEAQADNLLRR